MIDNRRYKISSFKFYYLFLEGNFTKLGFRGPHAWSPVLSYLHKRSVTSCQLAFQTFLFAKDISIIIQCITLKESTLNAEFMTVLPSQTNSLEQIGLH